MAGRDHGLILLHEPEDEEKEAYLKEAVLQIQMRFLYHPAEFLVTVQPSGEYLLLELLAEQRADTLWREKCLIMSKSSSQRLRKAALTRF